MNARVVQTISIAKAVTSCCCGSGMEADLDEDGVSLLREFMLLHRRCLGLSDLSEEVFEVDDDPAEAESSDY